MKKILIYSSLICPYCIAAKRLLENENLEYSEIIVDNNENNRKKMTKLANGKSSVPQIFFDDFHVGGFDDLKEIYDKGCLIRMLKDEKI